MQIWLARVRAEAGKPSKDCQMVWTITKMMMMGLGSVSGFDSQKSRKERTWWLDMRGVMRKDNLLVSATKWLVISAAWDRKHTRHRYSVEGRLYLMLPNKVPQFFFPFSKINLSPKGCYWQAIFTEFNCRMKCFVYRPYEDDTTG